MNVYTWDNVTRPSMNGDPVYSALEANLYIYLWDWGVGEGVNWFIGDNLSSNYRGVESPDMEFVENKCPEKINPRGTPWSVYTRQQILPLYTNLTDCVIFQQEENF